MRRLMIHEIKKTMLSRFIWLMTLLLFAVVLLDAYSPWDEVRKNRDSMEYLSVDLLTGIPDMSVVERNELFDYLHSFQSHFPSGEEQAKPGKYLETISMDLLASIYFERAQVRIAEVTANRELFISNAKRLGRKAIDEDDVFAMRRNADIIQSFSVTPDWEWSGTHGWDLLFSNRLSGIVGMLFVLGIGANCFSKEKETSAYSLIYTTKNGHNKTAGAKLLTTACLAFFFSVVSSLLVLLFHSVKDGIWTFSMPISMIDGFSSSPLNISVGQYFVITMIFRAFGAIYLSAIICLISVLCSSSLKSYIISSLFLSGSFGYSFWLTNQSSNEVLRVFDITSWTRPTEYFSRYYVMNLFDYPADWYQIHFAAAVLVMIVCVFLVLRLHQRKGFVL